MNGVKMFMVIFLIQLMQSTKNGKLEYHKVETPLELINGTLTNGTYKGTIRSTNLDEKAIRYTLHFEDELGYYVDWKVGFPSEVGVPEPIYLDPLMNSSLEAGELI